MQGRSPEPGSWDFQRSGAASKKRAQDVNTKELTPAGGKDAE